MGMDKVGKELVKGRGKAVEELKEAEKAEKAFEIAEGYFKAKNYSNAYFMFYTYLKRSVGRKIRKKIGVHVSDEEAVEMACEKELYGLDSDLCSEFTTGAALARNGSHIKKEACKEMRSFCRKLRS